MVRMVRMVVSGRKALVGGGWHVVVGGGFRYSYPYTVWEGEGRLGCG